MYRKYIAVYLLVITATTLFISILNSSCTKRSGLPGNQEIFYLGNNGFIAFGSSIDSELKYVIFSRHSVDQVNIIAESHSGIQSTYKLTVNIKGGKKEVISVDLKEGTVTVISIRENNIIEKYHFSDPSIVINFEQRIRKAYEENKDRVETMTEIFLDFLGFLSSGK